MILKENNLCDQGLVEPRPFRRWVQINSTCINRPLTFIADRPLTFIADRPVTFIADRPLRFIAERPVTFLAVQLTIGP